MTIEDLLKMITDALTEQAEVHARELRSYEATVANLTERVRELESDSLMADCMTQTRLDLMEAGIISGNVPPMMLSNAVVARIWELEVERVSEGYVIVPVEPTPEMIDAARWDEFADEGDIRRSPVSDDDVAGVYYAMLAAAPQPKKGEKPCAS